EGLSVRLGLTGHQRGRQLPFDETAIGLDHLAFAVPTRAELSDWETGASPRHGQPQLPPVRVRQLFLRSGLFGYPGWEVLPGNRAELLFHCGWIVRVSTSQKVRDGT